MKKPMLRCNENPLPKKLIELECSKGMVGEKDIYLKGSRLACKVVVFDNLKSLKRFWEKVMLGDKANMDAVTTSLQSRVEDIDSKGDVIGVYNIVEPKYFAFIGFHKNRLDLECIAHECVHAAFFYHARRNRDYRDQIDHSVQENIAYPAGELTKKVFEFIKPFEN